MIHAKGFSIVELLIVIVILTILAVIVVPNFILSREKAIRASLINDLRNLIAAEEAYYNSNQTYTQFTNISDFNISSGNVITMSSIPAPGPNQKGWHAYIKNVDLEDEKLCEVFIGNAIDSSSWETQIPGLLEREIKCNF